MHPCWQSCGVTPAWGRQSQTDSEAYPPGAQLIQRDPTLGVEGCSTEPEPLSPLLPRIVSTTPRDHSATNAKLASLGTPQRPRPRPAGPALAHTLMPPAGRPLLRMEQMCLGEQAVQETGGKLWTGRWETWVQILTWPLNCSVPLDLSGPQFSFPYNRPICFPSVAMRL